MPHRRVLVVDDDRSFCRLARRWMENEGYEAKEVYSAHNALVQAESYHPDLILLDVHLPHESGIKVFQTLRVNRETSHIPVILVTGMDLLKDLLDCTARDLRAGRIFRKNQGKDVLLKKVRRVFKHGRHGGSGRDRISINGRDAHLLSHEGITADPIAHRVWLDGRELPKIKDRLFDLLCALLKSDRPLSRRDLRLQVWGDEYHDINVVSMAMSRLRKILERTGMVAIKSSQQGYKLAFNPDQPPTRKSEI